MEDPLNDLFTEAVTPDVGSYIVFPGLFDEAIFVLRHLCTALFRQPEPFPNPGFIEEARRLIAAGLIVSDEVARQAGLGRGVAPIDASGAPVIVPPTKRFERLRQAATFPRSRLQRLLRRSGLAIEDLLPIVSDIGVRELEVEDPHEAPLLATPILRHRDRYVLAVPSAIPAALRHAAVRLAIRHGVCEEMVERYRRAVARTVEHSLDLIACQRLPIQPPTSIRDLGVSSALFQMDRDKVVLVSLITDDLQEYDEGKLIGTWVPGVPLKQAEERLLEVERHICAEHGWINEILHLVVVQNLGRSSVSGTGQRTDPFRSYQIILSAAALETIALLERDRMLVLRQYARASDRIRDHAVIQRFGDLDEFYLYREHRYSYYLGDQEPPRAVSILPGGAGELRREVQEKYDPHSVPYLDGATWVRVTLAHSDRSIPVYVPFPEDNGRVAFLVEGLPLPVWVVGPAAMPDIHHRSMYFYLAEMVSHWIWRMTPGLSDKVQDLARRQQQLQIHLRLDPVWFAPQERQERDSAIHCNVTGEGHLELYLGAGVEELLSAADNTGERAVMRSIVGALADLHRRKIGVAGHGCNAEELDMLIDRFVPLGRAKKMLRLRSDADPRLHPGDLPPYRKVQPAEEEVVLDEIGLFLTKDLGLAVGPIADQERTNVLREVVGFLYREIEREIATLDPDDLLEWLVAFYERVVYEKATREMSIPTRIACFATEPQMVKKLREEMPDLNKAAVPARFLVEYVAARPPRGLRPISLAVYDRLMALVSELVFWANASDVIRYKLSDPKLNLLASGRLGMGESQYGVATDKFWEVYAAGEIDRAARNFERYWRTPASVPPSEEVADMDVATETEFGLPLSQLVDFLGRVIDHGFVRGGAAQVAVLDDFLVGLAADLGWSRDLVQRAFEVFALRSRPDFLSPPDPFYKEDVYPWRFNRNLSYLRRPLLVRQTATGEEVVSGFRHSYDAIANLIALCLDGTLRARTDPMKHLISRQQALKAEAFNDRVAELYEQQARAVVHRRVRKINGKKIETKPGEDLGDIDVLVLALAERVIRVIEVKDLALARTPVELHFELEQTFETRGRRLAAVDKHLKRVAWIQRHVPEMLRWSGLSDVDSDSWRVEALIVLSEPLMSPYLVQSPIPVVSYRDLRLQLEETEYLQEAEHGPRRTR
ncbi:MAG: hypothetical protein M3Q29_15025 [Chloroflexota bacterium]|nr:hypothetical protein [Chloroflexota bacterium]